MTACPACGRPALPPGSGVDVDICAVCLGIGERPKSGTRIEYARGRARFAGVVRRGGCPTAEPGEVCSFVHVDVDGGGLHHVPLNRIVTVDGIQVRP